VYTVDQHWLISFVVVDLARMYVITTLLTLTMTFSYYLRCILLLNRVWLLSAQHMMIMMMVMMMVVVWMMVVMMMMVMVVMVKANTCSN